jgi:hypothetical protein
MFDAEQQRMVLQKTLEIIDDGVTTSTRGVALLSLTDTDTRPLLTSYYTFGVALTDFDGAEIPTYTNTYYGINGIARVSHDILPTLKDTQTIITFQKFYNGDTFKYEFHSGNLRGLPEQTQNTTVAIYLTNYTGTVQIQGTLDNTPGTFANYATIETKTYTNFTGVDYANAVGIWSDVRVKWYPDKSDLYGLSNYYSPEMPGNPTPGVEYFPNGKVDKILCRN